MRREALIVKVQISQNDGGRTCLIYNKDKTVLRQFETDEDTAHYMAGRAKAFFHAEVTSDSIKIQGESPWQEW
jgi:hypothetical protein